MSVCCKIKFPILLNCVPSLSSIVLPWVGVSFWGIFVDIVTDCCCFKQRVHNHSSAVFDP